MFGASNLGLSYCAIIIILGVGQGDFRNSFIHTRTNPQGFRVYLHCFHICHLLHVHCDSRIAWCFGKLYWTLSLDNSFPFSNPIPFEIHPISFLTAYSGASNLRCRLHLQLDHARRDARDATCGRRFWRASANALSKKKYELTSWREL